LSRRDVLNRWKAKCSLTIHPRPVLGESIGMKAEMAHGGCTDLPPALK